eukprot:TRINITY_DN48962_c0_g1_i4.p5 TRINITY_DN48962_c0_g1~~TRINITY_DN48962_c0_g1_i4.p5  ORF type:complete len:116 (-),score=4.79 TRINITY_DN48962_c0_g1_i4:173-520(-)
MSPAQVLKFLKYYLNSRNFGDYICQIKLFEVLSKQQKFQRLHMINQTFIVLSKLEKFIKNVVDLSLHVPIQSIGGVLNLLGLIIDWFSFDFLSSRQRDFLKNVGGNSKKQFFLDS